ncbi:hypothetical protein KOW79_019503 [Hemibagrus wyckioides]|uniref:Uncharacterized protein n=1 Tax=Hemibagrus wyckioides TaxID=337641 RepID=A0A9D3N9X6_9TELE|nr:hypothetical protein KOW79_019503 [Hemibagrus wyckioides]
MKSVGVGIGLQRRDRRLCVSNRPFACIWQKRPLFFLTLVSPLLFKNSAEKEETIFQNLQAVISRLPSFSTSLVHFVAY